MWRAVTTAQCRLLFCQNLEGRAGLAGIRKRKLLKYFPFLHLKEKSHAVQANTILYFLYIQYKHKPCDSNF